MIVAKHQVGNGRTTAFWLDVWLKDRALNERFPALFAVCDKPNILVAQVFSSPSSRPRFRRSFGQIELAEWRQLDVALVPVVITDREDSMSWSLEVLADFLPNPCTLLFIAVQLLLRPEKSGMLAFP